MTVNKEYLSHAVEGALAACGRERVYHRLQETVDPSVAIRWDEPRVTAPDGTERFLVRRGETLDAAGRAAAMAFAQRLREQARAFDEWATRVEGALKNWILPPEEDR